MQGCDGVRSVSLSYASVPDATTDTTCQTETRQLASCPWTTHSGASGCTTAMIGSLQGDSQNTSLDAELDALLPRACQQLLDSQHLDSPMKSVVQPAIRQYLYDFAADPHYRHFFGPFRFPGEAWLRGHKSETPNDDGSEEDDDEEREANWTLSGAQSEAETSGLSAEYLPSRKGRACGHIFKTGESVYRCK